MQPVVLDARSLHISRETRPHSFPTLEGVVTTSIHILVVEDEPIIADAVADRPRSDGFDISTADDGQGVCRRIRTTRRIPVFMPSVHDHVRSVRRKLGDDTIRTVHGIGYAFGDPQ